MSMYLFKQIPELMSICLTHLINCIYKTGIYPSKLKIARIIPLKKAGKSSLEFASYRPINNLCPIDKVVEETIRTRIDVHLTKNNVIPNNSHGSRCGVSTITATQEIEKKILKRIKVKERPL